MNEQIQGQLSQDEETAVPQFILDASVMDDMEVHEIVKEDIKQNRVRFLFPKGVNQLDLLVECRALAKLDDFDTMYDLTMQMLEGKPLTILMVCDDGSMEELCSFQVTDRYMDLRGIDVIDSFPCLVNWLTEFVGAYLTKKYRTPLKSAPSAKGSKKNNKTDSKGKTIKHRVR